MGRDVKELSFDSNDQIIFGFEEKRYTVSVAAYPTGNIQLPDGRQLSVGMWMESYPPQVSGLKLVETPVDNAALATEIVPEKKLKM
jgi:hypothetical protein